MSSYGYDVIPLLPLLSSTCRTIEQQSLPIDCTQIVAGGTKSRASAILHLGAICSNTYKYRRQDSVRSKAPCLRARGLPSWLQELHRSRGTPASVRAGGGYSPEEPPARPERQIRRDHGCVPAFLVAPSQRRAGAATAGSSQEQHLAALKCRTTFPSYSGQVLRPPFRFNEFSELWAAPWHHRSRGQLKLACLG